MKKNIYFYEKLVKILFFVYLAGMLSLGRAFAVIRIAKIGPIPVFVTEFLLLIAAPLIFFRRKKVFELPKKLLIVLTIFFLIGISYLGGGVLRGNSYSLRDIVLCGYILFLPLTLIAFSNKKDMMLFLGILFVCNLIGLVLGRMSMFRITFNPDAKHFTRTLRTFNLGLYYGITVSFMIAFFSFLKKKWHKLLVLFLVSLNCYVLTIFKTRTIEAAGIVLIIFLLIVLKRRFFKVMLYIIPVIIIVFSILGYYDSEIPIRLIESDIVAKGSMKTVIGKVLIPEIPSGSKESDDRITPDGIPYDKLPSSRLGYKSNLVWRLNIWYQAIHFGLKSPFFGRGFGVYPQYVVWAFVQQPLEGIGRRSMIIPAHNHLISIFYKMGLLGLVLFLVINYYVFSYGLRYIKKCKTDFTRCFLIGSLGAFVFWHAAALFFDLIDSPPTSIFLWVIIGFIFSIINIDKKNNEKKYL